jgi:hypothetical protein
MEATCSSKMSWCYITQKTEIFITTAENLKSYEWYQYVHMHTALRSKFRIHTAESVCKTSGDQDYDRLGCDTI